MIRPHEQEDVGAAGYASLRCGALFRFPVALSRLGLPLCPVSASQFDEALSRLRDPHRLALVLFHLEGLELCATAREMGVTEEVAAMVLAEGDELLRRELLRIEAGISADSLMHMLHGCGTAAPEPSALFVVRTVRAVMEAVSGMYPLPGSGAAPSPQTP